MADFPSAGGEGGASLSQAQQDAVDSITSLPDGTMPVVKSGKLEKSISKQTNNELISVDGRVDTIKDSIGLGQGLEISEDGGAAKISDKLDNIDYIPTGVTVNADGTTAGNFSIKRDNKQTVTLQPNQDETLSGTWAAWLPVTSTRVIKEVYFRFVNAATKVRFTLRQSSNQSQTDGAIIYQSHSDSAFAAGEGFNVPASPLATPDEFKITFTNSAKVVKDKFVYLVVEQGASGTGTLALRGDTTTIGGVNQFYAWMKQTFLDETKVVLPTQAENYPENTIPKVVNNVMVPSGMREVGGDLFVAKTVVAKKFKTKKKSIDLGSNFSLGSSADELEYRNINTGITRTTGHTTYNLSNGTATDEHFNTRRVWEVDNQVIQSDGSENSSSYIGTGANTVSGEYNAVINTSHVAFPPMVQHYFVRMNSDCVGVRLQVREGSSNTSPLIYESFDDFAFEEKEGTRGRIFEQALTGTISVTSGSADVTGVGTAFDTELQKDDIIRLPNQSNVEYVVSAVNSATSLKLQAVNGRPLPTITASGQSIVRGHTLARTDGGFTFKPNTTYHLSVQNKDKTVDIKGKNGALGQTGQFVFYFERTWQDVEFPEIPTAAHHHVKHLTQVYAGTGSIAQGGNVVTGSGTNFTTDFQVGDCFDLNGQVFTVQSIASNTSLTTNENATNATSGIGIYRMGDYVKWLDDAGREILKVDQQNNFTIDKGLTVKGDLNVQGTTTTVSSESLDVTNSYVSSNVGYTSATNKTGGFIVNRSSAGVSDTVSGGAFVAGVASTSNPTVVTVGSGTFTASDIIQIKDSTNNDGYYEVLSHTGNTLTVRGIGTTATVEDFSQNQFTAGTGNATITKVNVSVVRCGSDGKWEQGQGSTTPIAYVDFGDKPITFTDGAIPFSNSSGVLTQDAANLFWKDDTNRLGVATNDPKATLHAKGSALLGERYTTAETSASVPSNFTAIAAPTNLTGASGTNYDSTLRLMRDGESGTKYNMTADLEMGTYAGGLSARSSMRLRMGNGNSHTPDTDVAYFYGDASMGVGRLGIGYVKPDMASDHKLQVQGGGISVTDDNAKIRLSNREGAASEGITLRSDGNTSIANIGSELAADGNFPSYRMWRYRGTLAAPTATQGNDILGRIAFGGNDGSAGKNTSWVEAKALGNWSATNSGTKLDFYTSQQGNFPAQLAMTLEGNQDATFEGGVLSKGNVTVQGADGYNASGEKARLYLGDTNASVYGEHSYGIKFDVFGKTEALRIRENTGNVEIAGTIKIEGGSPAAGKVLVSDANGVGTWTDTESGDAQGAASSTDNALVRFDGTTGKTLQNSAATLDDTGLLDGLSGLNVNGAMFANGVVGTNTAPLADNERLRVTAASADTFDNSRAASIDLHGNQHPNAGRLDMVAGGNADITFWSGGFQRGTVSGTTGYWGIGSDVAPTVGLDMVGTSLLGSSIRNRTYTNDNSVGNFTQVKYRGSVMAPAAIQSGDFISDMRFGGFDSAQDALGLQLFATATENWTATNRGSQFTIASSKTGTTALDNAFRIDGANNAIVYESLGVGGVTPNAPIQTSNDVTQRKVVLWEGANNDHNFFGLGLNAGVMRYQVNGTTDSHNFYAGENSTTSRLLLEVKGDKSSTFHGNVQISGPDGYDLAGEQARLYLGDTNASVYAEHSFGMKFDVYGKPAALRIKENSGIVEFADKVKIEGGSPATGKKLICSDNDGNAQWGTSDTLTVQGTNGVALSDTFATVASITLPRAGKYRITGVARYTMNQKDSWSVAKLRNVTDSNDVGLSENLAWSTTAAMQVVNNVDAIITVNGAKVIDLEVKTGSNSWTGTTHSDNNGRCKISYEEL